MRDGTIWHSASGLIIQKPMCTIGDKMNNYKEYTDKYFLRSKKILQELGINPLVRYQVFARKDIDSIKGIEETTSFIRQHAPKAHIYSVDRSSGYSGNTAAMKIEGRVQDLIDLETVYLGILSGRNSPELDFDDVRKRTKEIVAAAQGKPVFYFGARHFHPEDDERIARICREEGFVGTSTDIGAKAWEKRGI